MEFNSRNNLVPGFSILNSKVSYLGIPNKNGKELSPNDLIIEGIRVDKKKNKMTKSGQKILFIEPHPDDLALSASGLFLKSFNEGAEITVLTIFSKFSLKTFPWKDIKLSEGEYEKLRLEESIFCFKNIYNVNYLNLGLSSALKRGHIGPFEKLDKEDKELSSLITKKINEILESGFEYIVIPGGFGGHNDHSLTYLAAITAAEKAGVKVIIYEEYPYVKNRINYPKDLKRLKKQFRFEIFYVDVKEYLGEIASMISIYRSQFDDITKTERMGIIKDDTRNVSYEAGNPSGVEFSQKYLRVVCRK